MTNQELAKKLGRKISAIRCKASKLKIRKNRSAIREFQDFHEIKLIAGRNLCRRCYDKIWHRKMRKVWNGETLLAKSFRRSTSTKTESLAAPILRHEGFEDIWHISRECSYFPCDFIATKNGQRYFIDVTIYHSKQTTLILRKLAERTGCKVSILFISPSKRRYYLMTHSDLTVGFLSLGIRRIQRAKPFPLFFSF